MLECGPHTRYPASAAQASPTANNAGSASVPVRRLPVSGDGCERSARHSQFGRCQASASSADAEG